MDFSYALTPIFAWIVAGFAKFLINSIKAKQLAFSLIGYGGMPSNHSAIVSSMAALIALKEGVGHPAFGVAVTLAFIVVLDAGSLRREIGRHGSVLNDLLGSSEAASRSQRKLRERVGHSASEIIAGIITGALVAGLVYLISVN